MIYLGCDLSQAESRVVFALTGHPEMLAIARAKPWERDMHTLNAVDIFGVDVAAVTGEQRKVGKIVSHAVQRGMAAGTMSDHMAKSYGLIISKERCQRFLDSYMRRHWPLNDYFKTIRQQAVRHRALSNSWGRVIYFEHDHLEDALFRELYSWLPQANVADLTNNWGMVPLARAIDRGEFGRAYLNGQGHDSLLASVEPARAYNMACFLQQRMEQPNWYWGSELSVPVEFSLGSSWDFEFDWKRLPPRAEFEEAAHACEAKLAARAAEGRN